MHRTRRRRLAAHGSPSRSKDETEIRAAENRDDPWNRRMRRNRVRSVDSAGRARAMTIRIAASILVIFAAGGFIAPVETSAQAGPYDGGRTAPSHSAFRAPTIRPAMAPLRAAVAPALMVRPAIAPPRPVVALARVHAAPLGHFRHRRAPMVVWGNAPWYNGYDASWYGGEDASWYSGYDASWYSDYDEWYSGYAPWYSGSGMPWYRGVENPTYVAAGRQNPPDTTDRNAMPPRLACRTQTYQVRSAEDGGERAVNIVRC